MCADSLQTSSVSKGCFVFKAKISKKSKPLNPCDYMQPDENDTDATWFRCNTYEALWDKVSEEVEKLQSEVNVQIFTDLIQFIKNAHSGYSTDDALPQQRPRRVIQEVPTAAFVAGVNVPDHSATFTSVTNLLKDQVTPHVASLLSRDCNNLRALMSNLVSQLMGTDDILSDDEEELNVKKIPATMPVLKAWYQDAAKKRKAHRQDSPPPKLPKKSPRSKRRRSSCLLNKNYPEYPPIVLLFEDLESFSPRVLQDFILICSQYLVEIPLVLIFGIATSVSAVHRILPQSVSSLLSIEKFQAQPSTVYLGQLISKVLLTPSHPFKLGHKVFQLLLDIFLFHDFSVINFVKGLQYSHMDHFFSNPLSLLCCNYGEGLNRVRSLNHNQLELFRQAASFRKYVEDQPPDQQRALLLDDKHLKKTLQELLKKLFDYHKAFYPVMECLNILTGHLPHHPLGKQKRELYSMCLEGNIWDSQGYKEAFALLRLTARVELMTIMTSCIERLSCSDNPIQEARFQLETFHARLQTLTGGCNEPVAEEVEEDTAQESSAKTERITLRSLQQKLMESVKKTRKPTRYESLVDELLEYLNSVFRKYLVCPQTLTLHEVFYYNSVSDVRRHINASPRAAIQTALNNPYHYLQGEHTPADTEGILATMPDVCIAYKLHMECGRLINLYDWLQAFITVVTGNQEDEDSSHGNKKPDPQLQARFIRAVSELQFLGFIKATRKKTDHVSRLTWGGI